MPPAETKSRPIIRAKFFIEKPPKTYKNDMNLQIFLDLTYNPCKNSKFYFLQVQNLKMVLIFTYNQDKVFLILPITPGRGGGEGGEGGTCIPGVMFLSGQVRFRVLLLAIVLEVTFCVDTLPA